MLRRVSQLVTDDKVEKLNVAAIKKLITILHCLQFAKAAWESISSSTIRNCWKKAGFDIAVTHTVDGTITDPLDNDDDDDNDEDLDGDIAELFQLDKSEPCRLAGSDDVVEIVNSLEPSRGGREECDQDEEVPEELPEPPSSAALLQALDTVRSALYACKADAALHSHLTKIETHLAAQAAARSRQSTLMELWN